MTRAPCAGALLEVERRDFELALAVRTPTPGRAFARAPGLDDDPVGDHESGIKADAELADEFGRAFVRSHLLFQGKGGCRNWRSCRARRSDPRETCRRHYPRRSASRLRCPGSPGWRRIPRRRAGKDRCSPRSAAFRRRPRSWKSARAGRCRAPNRSNEPSDAAGAPHRPGKHGVRFRSSPIHASLFILVPKFIKQGVGRRAAISRAAGALSRADGGKKIEPAGNCRPARVPSQKVWFRRRSGWGAASMRHVPDQRYGQAGG